MSDIGPLVPALEKGVYSSFRQAEVTFRQGQIGSKIIDYDKLQLPVNSVLHICDNYLESPVTTILPNLDDPFIKNEAYKKYLDFVLTMPTKTDPLFPITDSFRYRPYSYNTIIRHFFTTNKDIYKFTTRAATIHQSNALPILNYNVISTAVVTGTFVYYRKFDLLLKTILSNVVSIEDKHQYLQIEMSKRLYSKSQFQQTFDKINYQTVRIKDDPSFYFLVHLINFVSKTATTSLFSKLTQIQLDQFNVILTAGTKAVIYNMGDLKAMVDSRQDNNLFQMVIRHINALKLSGYSDKDISELDDNEYDKIVDAAVQTHGTEPTPVTDTKTPSPVEPLPITTIHKDPIKSTLDEHSDVTPGVVPEPIKPVIEPDKKTAGANKISVLPEPLIKDRPVETPATLKPYDASKLTSVIDHGAYRTIINDTHLSEDQRSHAIKTSQLYKKLSVDGVSIEELLDQTAEPDITKGHLDFLSSSLPDQSMLNSTVIDLDKHYVEQMMAKDIAAIAANMATNGMFLVEVNQKNDITELDRMCHYKFTYEDTQGRKHRVVFKLPIVSPDGTILVNGIESRMVKQQVNLPICKIDTWRVSLSSNYNKTLVERIATKAHNYGSYITKYIAAVYKAKVGLEIGYGHLTTDVKLPYDYTSIAERYSRLSYLYWDFTFDYDDRFKLVEKAATEALAGGEKTLLDTLSALEKKHGVYCGKTYVVSKNADRTRLPKPFGYMFFGYDNFIRTIDIDTGEITLKETFTSLFFRTFGEVVDVPKQLSEWTELKILDKNFPIVFILGFEFGLKKTLDHIKLDYKFYPLGERFDREVTTIVVTFSDGNLVFDRYPLEKSFVAAGLLKFQTKMYSMDKFNTPDGYYTLLQDNNLSMNFLKGIVSFFKLFVDPITRDVLIKMHEPTDVAGLLLRATQMLVTDDAIPSSSMENHRLRGYERFPSLVYNEMARAFATFQNQRGNRKVFSINPDAVFLRIIQDQSLHIIDDINPMENIKDKHSLTYAGFGGRTAQSFVIEDRRYPKDGVGILSECTPDSGKVAINAYVTANPVIANIRGMFDVAKIDQSKLEPSQILSVTSLLMPCSTNDNNIRTNYLSIQLKHHVPSQYSETNRIRTGYELVVAHRTGDTFACVAQRDGVIEEVNSDLGLIKIKYHRDKAPPLDLMKISNSNAIRTKFQELAHAELLKLNPIYIVQEDSDLTHFKQGDQYQIDGHTVKVIDISPLDLNDLPMDYLNDSAKAVLKKAKEPVLVKLIPADTDESMDRDIFKFGTKFSSVSGSYLKQNIVANVKAGDVVSRGDVVAYNTGFFELDQFNPKQVTWKHGVMTRIALMECNDTIEDSNAITRAYSKRLNMEPVHLRSIEMTENTILTDLLPVGTEVQTTDLLCTMEDADIGSLTESEDSEVLDLLTELNRKSPRARYHGIISEIDVLYSCPIEDMHPSVATIVKQINARKAKIAKSAKNTFKDVYYTEPSLVVPGTKFHGTEFGKNTILFMIYIEEIIDQGTGDKLVVGLQAKSVTATIIEEPISTETGYPIDMLFSGRGISNRILLSPTIIGFSNRVLEEVENQVVHNYFKE